MLLSHKQIQKHLYELFHTQEIRKFVVLMLYEFLFETTYYT